MGRQTGGGATGEAGDVTGLDINKTFCCSSAMRKEDAGAEPAAAMG